MRQGQRRFLLLFVIRASDSALKNRSLNASSTLFFTTSMTKSYATSFNGLSRMEAATKLVEKWHVSLCRWHLLSDVTVSNIAMILDKDTSRPSIDWVLYTSSPPIMSFKCSSLMLALLPWTQIKYNTFEACLNISGLSWCAQSTVANFLLRASYWSSSKAGSDLAIAFQFLLVRKLTVHADLRDVPLRK